MTQNLPKLIEIVDEITQNLGCHDRSCIFYVGEKPRTGQCTNGGCKCLHSFKASRLIQRLFETSVEIKNEFVTQVKIEYDP